MSVVPHWQQMKNQPEILNIILNVHVKSYQPEVRIDKKAISNSNNIPYPLCIVFEAVVVTHVNPCIFQHLLHLINCLKRLRISGKIRQQFKVKEKKKKS